MREGARIIFIIFITINILADVILFPLPVSAWGDNSGNPDGRPEYTTEQINNGALGDTITFNSISDNPMGHEFNFVGAREDTGVNAGADNVWNGNEIAVEDGKTYMVRMYVHNNNPRGRDAVAKDVRVAFNIPQESSNEIQIDGFINSSNASPTEYWDDVVLKSDSPFHLEYVPGSARLSNNGVGNVKRDDERNGIDLSDDIVKAASGGISIGYDSAKSGEIPGCYEFDNFVTILVKVVYDHKHTIKTSVRPAGTKGKNWTDLLEVNVGDEVEYQIEYKNTSDEDQYNVMLRNYLPNNIEYTPGSTRLWNSKYTGATIDQDDLVTEKGINIGAYGPGANAYVRFNARVVDKDLAEGSNTLVNWAQGWVEKSGVQDYANVHLWKKGHTKNKIIMLIVIISICMIVLTFLIYRLSHIRNSIGKNE